MFLQLAKTLSLVCFWILKDQLGIKDFNNKDCGVEYKIGEPSTPDKIADIKKKSKFHPDQASDLYKIITVFRTKIKSMYMFII